MYTVLYRQHRPKILKEVVGQEHVTTTLANALSQGRLAHAYLFAGPRGVGKTTVARILARAVNCKQGVSVEPCGACTCCESILSLNCLDVIEIDAASNRGIDEIRDLREKVRFYPAECRYKVYIIDEVHMLTPEAFNALLKTLEEPPPHALFILATTEAHKIPLTILSRCQRFDFHRLEPEQIVGRLQEVTEAAGGTADQEALISIARAADGALRDAISVLDQAFSLGEGHVGEDVVLSILGIPDKMALSRAVVAIAEKDLASIFELVDEVQKTGRDLRQFTKDLGARIRDLLLVDSKTKRGVRHSESDLEQLGREAALLPATFLIDALKAVTEAETEMRWNASPRLVLETCLLSLANKATPAGAPAQKSGPAAQPDKVTQADKMTQAGRVPTPPDAALQSRVPAAEPAASVQGDAVRLDPDAARKAWAAVIERAKKERPTVGALLHYVKPGTVKDGTVVLTFVYPSHTEIMYKPENRDVLEKALAASLGQPVKTRFEAASAPKQAPKDPAEDPLVKSVLEAFGGEIIPDEKPQR
ncbi:MAG: DNA polymerase III subunit gamma/tau [Bacillota bacterium]|nr:DNA polymerase III subunit gamma/tau [Bacillota bacterium]